MMKSLTAAQQRFFDNAVLLAALQLIFDSLEKFGVPMYPLGEVANTTSGGTPDRGISDYYGGNIPWIKSGELRDGPIKESEEYITDAGLQNSSAKVFPKGTLVVALYGATVGKTGILAINAASNQAVCAITPNNRVSTFFLFWFLRYKRPDFLKGSFGAAQPNISQKVLRETLIPVPTTDLQKEICNFLEIVEERQRGKKDFLLPHLPSPLSNLRDIVARIEELAARIEEARGLRREAVEEAEALINAYARRLLATANAELTELRYWLDESRDGIQTGPFGAQLGKQDFESTGVPVLSIGNIQYYGLELSELKYVSEEKAQSLSRFSIKEGDILFARMGTVGRCCVTPQKAEGWLFNYHIIRVALDKAQVDPRYIHWSIRASKDIENYLGEKIRGATREGVNSSIVSSLPVRIPSLSKQHDVVTFLDDLQAKVNALRQFQSETSAELDALLPSILDKAFKGEL